MKVENFSPREKTPTVSEKTQNGYILLARIDWFELGPNRPWTYRKGGVNQHPQ